MSDLISRADALKALKGMSVTYDAETVQRCIEVVSNLPSADAVPVIRCKDCKHYDGFDCDRYADETYGISHSTQEYGYCWVAERKENDCKNSDK